MPLPRKYKKKLVIGLILVFLSAIGNLFSEAVGEFIGVNSRLLELVSAVFFFSTLYWLAYGAKCPGCGINLFWYGLANAKNANWVNWILMQPSCPKCGYRETGKRTGRENRVG